MNLQAHHHHAGDPEEDDVEARDQHAGRDRTVSSAGVLSGQPSVENGHSAEENQVSSTSSSCAQLRVRRQRVLLAHLGFVAADVDLAGVVVPGRNAMAPPELAAHAPVLDVAHPLVIRLRPVLRHEARASVFDGRQRGLGQRRDLHVPLVGEIGLDDGAGAVAARHFELVRLYLLDESGGFELGDDLLARHEAVQAAETLGRVLVESGVGREDVDLRQRSAAGPSRSR